MRIPYRLPKGTGGNDLTLDGDLTVGGNAALQTVNIDPNATPPTSPIEGDFWWEDGTINFQTAFEDTVIQGGQEVQRPVRNTSGVTIDNGMCVYPVGSSGVLPLVAKAQANSPGTSQVVGLCTIDDGIGHNNNGLIVVLGTLRGVQSDGANYSESWTEGDTLYLSATVAGGLTNVMPVHPNEVTRVGSVGDVHASNGTIEVAIGTSTATWNGRYIPDVGTPADDDVLAYDLGNTRYEPKAASVTVPVVLSSYTDLNSRNLDQNLHGGIDPVSTAEAVSSGSPANVTIGLGKMVLSVIAGADTSGTVTITGTSVDRNTGAETGADTDTLTIDGVTTDSTSTDAEGNTIYGLTNAYITSKWFKGAIVISTTDVNLSDFDVYVVAFEQFNDTSDLTLQTLDATLQPTNAAAWVYMYLYTVKVTGDTIIIANVATLALTSADSVANRFYRLRKGLINEALDGTTDGVILEIFLGPDPLAYISQMTIKIWADLELPITLT
jgi:hypothetical protein